MAILVERTSSKANQFGAGKQTEWKDAKFAADNTAGTYAVAELPASNGVIPFPGSCYLVLTDFGFDSGANPIPVDAAKIVGIQVKFKVLATSNGTIISKLVQLTKNGRVGVRSNRGNAVEFWPLDGDLIYGEKRDRWREPGKVKVALKPTAVRDKDFGVILQVENLGRSAADAYVDSVLMRVWYEP